MINKCIICECDEVHFAEIDIPLLSETNTVLSLKVKGAKCVKCGYKYFSQGTEIVIDRIERVVKQPLREM